MARGPSEFGNNEMDSSSDILNASTMKVRFYWYVLFTLLWISCFHLESVPQPLTRFRWIAWRGGTQVVKGMELALQIDLYPNKER